MRQPGARPELPNFILAERCTLVVLHLDAPMSQPTTTRKKTSLILDKSPIVYAIVLLPRQLLQLVWAQLIAVAPAFIALFPNKWRRQKLPSVFIFFLLLYVVASLSRVKTSSICPTQILTFPRMLDSFISSVAGEIPSDFLRGFAATWPVTKGRRLDSRIPGFQESKSPRFQVGKKDVRSLTS